MAMFDTKCWLCAVRSSINMGLPAVTMESNKILFPNASSTPQMVQTVCWSPYFNTALPVKTSETTSTPSIFRNAPSCCRVIPKTTPRFGVINKSGSVFLYDEKMLVSKPFNALIKTTNAIAPTEYPNNEIPVIRFTTVGFDREKKYRFDM